MLSHQTLIMLISIYTPKPPLIRKLDHDKTEFTTLKTPAIPISPPIHALTVNARASNHKYENQWFLIQQLRWWKTGLFRDIACPWPHSKYWSGTKYEGDKAGLFHYKLGEYLLLSFSDNCTWREEKDPCKTYLLSQEMSQAQCLPEIF